MARRKPKDKQQEQEAAAQEKPKSRIAADLSQQAPHTSWAAAPLFYEDVRFTCADCGREEIWTAEQQKWWYETAKGYVFSKAIRCKACRAALRAQRGSRSDGSSADE